YFCDHKNSLKADCNGLHREQLQIVFWRTLNKALELTHKSFDQISGHLLLENTIPIGAGIGFSAALCVAVARWFHWMNWISQNDIFRFSRLLENLFHGKSSGVDIAGAMSDQIIRYRINSKLVIITPLWKPKLFLSFSNQHSMTKKCVKEVENLWNSNPNIAKHV